PRRRGVPLPDAAPADRRWPRPFERDSEVLPLSSSSVTRSPAPTSSGLPPKLARTLRASSPIFARDPTALDEQIGKRDGLAAGPRGTGFRKPRCIEQVRLQRQHAEEQIVLGR